jgi:phosphoenolpyruvate-protein phosphotransferase (PTS system enzyme I)
MSFAVHGQAVSRGVTIGRAVVVGASHMDVSHYLVDEADVPGELLRLRRARDLVIQEIDRVKVHVATLPAADAPAELTALLDVQLMLLQDVTMAEGVRTWIEERRYNVEWALTSQLDAVSRQFDEMEDPYLRERKADVAQLVERLLAALKGGATSLVHASESVSTQDNVPLVLVAHDLSPSDLLQFKQSVFSGFVTDVGGKTSHTAIVARSLDIPAVVGARAASQLIKQDDWVIIDGDAGVVVVDPSDILRDEYTFKQRQGVVERERLGRLRNTPSVTLDGQRVELMANIELPTDAAAALAAGAVGVGLFRSEFLFMGRVKQGKTPLPDEEEQYQAYRDAVDGMAGLPVTIRTVDVGADKPLDSATRQIQSTLNPALGLRAIRWSLAEPSMFLTQLRAILRAAAHGQVNILFPMVAHLSEVRQTLALLERARAQLDTDGVVYGPVRLGAMVEVPAAAVMAPVFLQYFDFLSIGTNDLIQYTLAIDRTDEAVAHLYDATHPAVLRLIAQTLQAGKAAGKEVAVCGEMAGDVGLTALLLGMGLRHFSMHPSQLLAVKQQVLRSDTQQLARWAEEVLNSAEPQSLLVDA